MNRRQLLAGATAALTSSCIPTSPAPAAEAPLIVFGEEVEAARVAEICRQALVYYRQSEMYRHQMDLDDLENLVARAA